MLVRAARRNVQAKTFRSISSSRRPILSPLSSPTLCATQRGRSLTVDGGKPLARHGRRNSKDASATQPTRRSLATAVTYQPFDDIPFEGLGDFSSTSRSTGYSDINDFLTLKPFDPESLIRLDDPLTHETIKHRRHVKTGLGGEVDEMRSIFEACIHVGRLERASTILDRVRSLEPDSPMLIGMHNMYLRQSVEKVMLNPSTNATQAIHKWFEMNMVQKDIAPDAQTIAYMVKVSLKAKEDRRYRLVTRYMDMISKDTVYEVLCLDILSAQEINQVVHICPEYKLAEGMPSHPEEPVIEVAATQPTEVAAIDQSAEKEYVRETEQKGLGMKSLRQTLSLFSNLPINELQNASAEQRKEIQRRLEEDAVDSAIERWREESVHLNKMGLNTSLQTKSLGARMWKWQLALKDYIKEEIKKVNAAEVAEKRTSADNERVIYGPFLRVLPPEKVAAITILTVMTMMGGSGLDKGLTLSNVISQIAHSVEEESAAEILQQTSKRGVWPVETGGTAKRSMTAQNLRRMAKSRRGAVSKTLADLDSLREVDHMRPKQWNMFTNAKVGAFLMSALIETAKIPVTVEHPDSKESMTQMQPAFIHSYQYKMGKKVGLVYCNNALVTQLRREPVHSLLAKHLPMLVEPEPWSKFNKGGFLVHPAKVMRIKIGDKDQRYYAEAAIGLGNMEQTFKGLDVLGKTPWQINQPVYDVMIEAWNSGEAVANIPPENPVFNIPREPDCADDPLLRREWIKSVKQMENTKSGLHSVRCFQNFQLEIARALKQATFYFPHNVDFRGRAYPIPPYLNHMGADHCRGLLKFAQARELGESGLKWLKIHFANVYGFDKASLSEREQFANTHMDDIYDSANNGLKGNRFWLKAEDPWQCLAACVEIRDAIESGNPATFKSQLPVHQDGTCNGLQHYAALGGDSWGARQVNLEPGDRPADVYSAVANLVKDGIAHDKEQGVEMAILLDGKITRKTVKQTVMTNVYGVTFVGAKAQVRKQLIAANLDLPNTKEMNPDILAAYIATKIFTALSSMFKGAHDIQYWLGECANRISLSLTPEQMDRMEGEDALAGDKKSSTSPTIDLDQLVQFKSSVIWTNPLQMPVVQPYRQGKSRTVSTHLQSISLSEPHRSNPVSKRKQLQGFPPNFVHSLDATHMLLSALKCDQLGLSFAAVHDSFWTHAADIDTMNTVLRDAFIRIHSEDVIGRLRAEFEARYKNSFYQARVRCDSPVYQKILDWRAEHMTSPIWRTKERKSMRIDELILERQRVRLLASSNPKDVKKGKAMVTPTSIFQEYAAAHDLATDAEMTGVGLGEISSRPAGVDLEDPVAPEVTEVDVVPDEEVQEVEGQELGHVKNAFERSLTAKHHKSVQYSAVWLPLAFPPVPEKVCFPLLYLYASD